MPDTKVGCSITAFTVDDNLRNTFLNSECHLRPTLFCGSLMQAGNMPHLLIHLIAVTQQISTPVGEGRETSSNIGERILRMVDREATQVLVILLAIRG